MTENNNGISVTLKGGRDFDAPWIVIHAADAESALAQVNDVNLAELARRTADAAEFFRGYHATKQGFPAAKSEPVQQNSGGPSWSQGGSGASQQQQAPAQQGGAKVCQHGEMIPRSGTSAKGPWSGYFCPLPRERKSEQCAPVFGK